MRYGTLSDAFFTNCVNLPSGRQVMEIKPAWLLEGLSIRLTLTSKILTSSSLVVAPHFFKQSDVDEMMAHEKKMPKAVGASSTGSGARTVGPRP